MIKRNKRLALALSGIVIASNLGTATVSASTQVENNIATLESNELVKGPDVKNQTLNFDKSNPQDLVINGVDYADRELKSFSFGHDDENKKLDVSKLRYNEIEKTLTVPAKLIKDLNLENNLYSCKLVFSDETILVGAININVTDSGRYPNVEGQTLEFDKANPQDLVINGVDYANRELKSFSFGHDDENKKLDVSKLRYSEIEKTLTVPAKLIKDLNLENNLYSCKLVFSDETILVGAININVTDSSVVVTPPVEPTPPEEDKPQVPPTEEEKKNPTVEEQVVEFDVANGQDVVISGVNFTNTKLKYIYIGANKVEVKDLVVGENTVTIPAKVLANLNIVLGNYTISFKFSNDVSVTNKVDLKVTDSSVVVPPTEEKVEIDKNNLKDIEIPNFLPKDSKVSYITINGKELPVIYKDLKVASIASSAPAVYVVGDKLVLPVEVLEYVGFETANYDIEAVLEDGSKVSKTIVLDIKDSSQDKEDGETPGEGSEEKPEDGQKPEQTPTEKDETTSQNKDNKKDESQTIGTDANTSNVPKTGDAVAVTLIGAIVSGIGAVLLRRKK